MNTLIFFQEENILKTTFRRTRCLFYEGTPHQQISDCVITGDGGKHIIHTMKDGTEYFYIDNPYRNGSIKEKMFMGLIGDAVQAVFDGYADAIIGGDQSNVFSKGYSPVVLLDREKAEQYRQKTIDGWKGARFGWGIEFGGKNSFGGYRLLDMNGLPAAFSGDKPLSFATKEEAEAHFDQWHKMAMGFAKEYVEGYGNEEKCDGAFNKARDTGIGIMDNLMLNLIKEESDGKVHIVDDPMNLEHVGWSIVQVVIQD